MQSSHKIHKKLVEMFVSDNIDFRETKVTKYPFPLPLNICEIYAFRTWFAKPTTMYVVISPEYDPVPLSCLEVFEEILLVDEFMLSTAEQALAYTTTAFTLAPPLPGLFYIISEAGDLPIWELEKRNEIVARFESVITPPVVTTIEGGYRVAFYACHNDTLRYYTVQVSSGGHVEESSKIVAEGLPLPVRL